MLFATIFDTWDAGAVREKMRMKGAGGNVEKGANSAVPLGF